MAKRKDMTNCRECLRPVDPDKAFWCPVCMSGYPVCDLCKEEHIANHEAEGPAAE